MEETEFALREQERDREGMIEELVRSLGSRPRTLSPKWFYDARGSRLFEEITRLPEYYQTDTEREILSACADSVVENLRPSALVEYGSGSAGKTRVLLDAMERADLLEAYAPIDVSPEPVREVSEEFSVRYPGTRIVGIVADFESEIELPFEELPRLVIFLGGTIGNFPVEDGVRFLRRVAGQLVPRDGLLIGFDLVKDRELVERAYNDSEGVTAEFNRNALRVLNRELDADFEPEAFRHRAFWNEDQARIEMHLVSEREQVVHLAGPGREIRLEEGESIRTELSHKYTRASARGLLAQAGLKLERWETDPEQLFAVGLARIASG